MSAHAKTDLKVHLIWIPKYRKKVLTGEIAIRVREIIREIALQHKVEILSGKIASDHVHILIKYRADQMISDLVRYFKGKSAHILFNKFEHLRKIFPQGNFWARGYCAISTGGHVNSDSIKQYIANHEE